METVQIEPGDASNMETVQVEPGDAFVERIGEIRLADGAVIWGALLSFPAGPPDLPISIVWERLPVRITAVDRAAKRKA